MTRQRMRGALLVILALPLISCTTDPLTPPIVPVRALTISGAPLDGVFVLGGAQSLGVTVLGPDDVPLGDRRVRWRSALPGIASVDGDGVVSGLAVGATTIEAESEGVASQVAVEVREGVLVPSVGAPTTAMMLSGLVELSVPVGVAAPGTPIHARVAPSWPTDDRLITGTVVELGLAGMELAQPIIPGVRFDPNTIPAVDRPLLRLFAVDAGGQWAELPGGGVDLATFRVSAELSRLTTIAVFRRSTPTALAKIAGDGQVVPRGTAVPTIPVVEVRDAAGRPVSGIEVTFDVGPGGGQLTGSGSAFSGLDGRASPSGQWRVGSAAGTYTLIASIAGGIQVTFTATATP